MPGGCTRGWRCGAPRRVYSDVNSDKLSDDTRVYSNKSILQCASAVAPFTLIILMAMIMMALMMVRILMVVMAVMVVMGMLTAAGDADGGWGVDGGYDCDDDIED